MHNEEGSIIGNRWWPEMSPVISECAITSVGGFSNTVIRFNGWFPLLCSSPGVATLLADRSIHNSWEETDATTMASVHLNRERKQVWFTHWTVQSEEQVKLDGTIHCMVLKIKKRGSCGVDQTGSSPGWHKKGWAVDGCRGGGEEMKTPRGTNKNLFSLIVNV